MSAAPFNTLELAHKLEQSGFSRQQAEGAASALAGAFVQDLATKHDVRELDHKIELLRRDLELMARSLTIRLGGMIAAGVIVVGALVGLF
jgi:hypothetical protein